MDVSSNSPAAAATPTKTPRLSKSIRKTPKSTRKPTPGIAKQFAFRRQNRLLRSELATVLGRCSQLERTVTELRTLLEEERENTIKPTDQQENNAKNERIAELQRQLLSVTSQRNNSPRAEQLQARLDLTRRSNQELRKNVADLSRVLVEQKKLIADYQGHTKATRNKAETLYGKLHEAVQENRVLKMELSEMKASRRNLVRQHRINMTNLITKVEDLMKAIERDRVSLSVDGVFKDID